MSSGASGIASILSGASVSTAQIEQLLKVGNDVAQVGQLIGQAIAAPAVAGIAPISTGIGAILGGAIDASEGAAVGEVAGELEAAEAIRQPMSVPEAILSSLGSAIADMLQGGGAVAGTAQGGDAVGDALFGMITDLHDNLKALGDALIDGREKLEQFAREAFDNILKQICGDILGGNEAGQATGVGKEDLNPQSGELKDARQTSQDEVACGTQALIKWLMEHVANPLAKIEQLLQTLTEKKAPDVSRRLESIDDKMSERPEQNQLAFTEFVNKMAEYDSPRRF